MTNVPDRERAALEHRFQASRHGADKDHAAVARRLHILPYCFIGMAFGAAIGGKFGGFPGAIIGAIAGFALMYGAVQAIVEGSGEAVATLYAPSGSSTPAVREYSLAQSLIMREQYDAAVAQLEDDARDNADDPTPLVLLARVSRDRLRDHERALGAFRRVLRMPQLDAGLEHQLMRELVEVCEHRMHEPARALPELARFADRQGATTAGAWARAELKRLKAGVAGA
jgi:hypothetical protein